MILFGEVLCGAIAVNAGFAPFCAVTELPEIGMGPDESLLPGAMLMEVVELVVA